MPEFGYRENAFVGTDNLSCTISSSTYSYATRQRGLCATAHYLSYHMQLRYECVTTVVDTMFARWQFSQPDAIQLAAYSICAVGFALNALPSNWLDHALGALGVRSRDNTASARIVTSLYERARRATCAHLP